MTFCHRVEALFQKKFFGIIGILIAAFTFVMAACNYLREKNLGTLTILIIGVGASIVILLITYMLGKRFQ